MRDFAKFSLRTDISEAYSSPRSGRHVKGFRTEKTMRLRQAVLACEPLENRRLLSLTAPQLDSLPGAPVKLYLDFVGIPAFQWDSASVAHGPGSNSTPIPAFSYDADINNFSGTEL